MDLTVFDDIDLLDVVHAAETNHALVMRRRCVERVNEIRMQGVLADQFKAEANRLKQRAEEAGEDQMLRDMHLAKAVVLETQAIGALDRVTQAKLELEFYLRHHERSASWQQ